MNTLSGIVYLVAGCAVIQLFRSRRRELSTLTPERMPELSPTDFKALVVLLKTAYERTLYMGVLFLPLAWTSMNGSDRVSTLFFLLLIGLLFLSNIAPRQKIMRLLEANGLSMAELNARGIRL